MYRWKKWFTERPSYLFILAPSYLILAAMWAHWAHSINKATIGIKEFSGNQSDLSRELLYSYPWISLVGGLTYGSIFGIWHRRRVEQYMDRRVEQLCNSAHGHQLKALFSPLPGTLFFWSLILLPIVAAVVVPFSILSFFFAAGAMFSMAVYPAERTVWRMTEVRLRADLLNAQTNDQVQKWQRFQRRTPAMMTALLAVTVVSGVVSVFVTRHAVSIFEQIKNHRESGVLSGSLAPNTPDG